MQRLKTDKHGYVSVRCRGHLRADKRGFVKRATLVAEATLGRNLLPGEIAHHANRIKYDDRPENISVMSQSEHITLHLLEDKGRRWPRADAHYASKLTSSLVAELRAKWRSGQICRQLGGIQPAGATNIAGLAATYGVSRRTICRAIDGEDWKKLGATDDEEGEDS